MRPIWLALVVLAAPQAWSASAPDFRIESRPVSGGAELLTVFSQGNAPEHSSDVPLLSILRDTLGDADSQNDRLRDVWILTAANPTLLQRAAAAVPFLYIKPKLGSKSTRKPATALDLGDTASPVWAGLAQTIMQVMAIDSNGALIRASTRRYRANLDDRRRVHLVDGLAVLSKLDTLPEADQLFSESDLLAIQARLSLAGQTLGGLVTTGKLSEAYYKQRAKTEVSRGHNWELLRQRAEANGLYFEGLGMDSTYTHAILYVAKEDVQNYATSHVPKNPRSYLAPSPALQLSLYPTAPFDGAFLGISNPFTDQRLLNWNGVKVIRYFDRDNRMLSGPQPHAHARELIPIALYGLNYPKVPYLLVDFRDSAAPKRREIVRRGISDTLTGVLGISKFGNWPYMGGAWAYNFVTSRHGAASNRQARLAAYSEVRRWLALDTGMEPALRHDLQKRLEVLGINPLEDSVFDENEIARRQYAALLRYADDPRGLPARLAQDREEELVDAHHGSAARALFAAVHLGTLGLYTHTEAPRSGDTVAQELDQHRRTEYLTNFLEEVASSSPQTDPVWNLAEVRKAVASLASRKMTERTTKLIEQIRSQTADLETREACDRALGNVYAVGQ